MRDQAIQRALQQLIEKTGQQIVAQYPYAYPLDFSTIAATAVGTATLQFAKDGHFLMERINGYTFDNASSQQAALLRRNVTMQITDQASQNTMFQDFVPMWDIAGDSYVSGWFTVNEPRVFLANSSILAQLVNNTALTLVGSQLTLIGRKLVMG